MDRWPDDDVQPNDPAPPCFARPTVSADGSRQAAPVESVMAGNNAAGPSAAAQPVRTDLPLFLFGTLRDPALFEVVFGRPQQALACRPALLPGHAAMRVDGADFPVLVAAPACRQPGLLVAGLAPAEIDRAVFYESTGYRLALVRLVVERRTAVARAFLPTGRLPVSDKRWRLALWRRRHGLRVVTAAALALEHYGRVDAAGFEALWPEIERETAARLATAKPSRDARRRRAVCDPGD